MKSYILFSASCLMLSLFIVAAEDDERKQYTTKFDNVDIDSVLRNVRLLNNYVGCLLEKNPCTPDATELKTNLPDALATDCSSCSEAQKRIADKLSHFLIDHRPVDWSLLEEKYDPTGAYRERYLHSREVDENKETSSIDEEPASTEDEIAEKSD